MRVSLEPLSYPFPRPPDPGCLFPVAPGVYQLRMPLPFALDHINLWLLEDGDGWALVDCGIGNEEGKAIWQGLLSGPLAGRPIKRIFVTHFHPDHIGLAGWLSRTQGAEVVMTSSEWALAQQLHATSAAERNQRQNHFFRVHGFTGYVPANENPYRERVPELPCHCRLIDSNSSVVIGGNSWQVLIGQGHSPEQLCLYCAELNLLISGDQVLPRISPNISVSFLNPDADPLSEYLLSLDRWGGLPATVRVLPAHGPVFEGLSTRIVELQQHHQQRLDLLLAGCDSPCSAMDALRLLFNRSFDAHELFFAFGESVAHLHRLWAEGLVVCRPEPDGLFRFVRCRSS